jgi:hypothetical protein
MTSSVKTPGVQDTWQNSQPVNSSQAVPDTLMTPGAIVDRICTVIREEFPDTKIDRHTLEYPKDIPDQTLRVSAVIAGNGQLAVTIKAEVFDRKNMLVANGTFHCLCS